MAMGRDPPARITLGVASHVPTMQSSWSSTLDTPVSTAIPKFVDLSTSNLFIHCFLEQECATLRRKSREIHKMAISFSVKVAAAESGLSERSIHEAIKDGRLEAMRVGRRVLITPGALEDYLHGKPGRSKAGAK